MELYITVFISIIFTTVPGYCDIQPHIVNSDILTQSKSLGDCLACRLFTESFKSGLERTSRGQYEGGDVAWEEEKLKKSYKRSEMRLIDIQDSLCKESKYAVQCHSMAEKAEEFIEQWWSQNPDDNLDIFPYICIDNMKVCCPKHHFGKDCLPCEGGIENICSGHGKCRGDGTRKGNGTCHCDIGYDGDFCDHCSSGYYISSEDGDRVTCSKCHKTCLDDCRQGSANDCLACKPGYKFETGLGCTDINECDEPNKCKREEFCMNSQGSYACFPCDKSCEGCFGDGPDMCRKCAKGYSKKDDSEFCTLDSEEEDNQFDELTRTRYDL